MYVAFRGSEMRPKLEHGYCLARRSELCVIGRNGQIWLPNKYTGVGDVSH